MKKKDVFIIIILAGRLLIFISLWSAEDCFSQIMIGVKTGVQIPGAQDLKFKQFDRSLELTRLVHSNRVIRELSAFSGAMITIFGKKGFLENKGIRIETATWEFNSRSRGFFVDHPPQVKSIEQFRSTVMASILWKFDRLPFMENIGISGSYLYAGTGGGIVLTDIDPGKYQWHLGFNLLSGIGVPLFKNLEGVLELKYLITHDADNNQVNKYGWYVDTSGTSSWLRFGPHLDTRFLTFQVGLQWVISP